MKTISGQLPYGINKETVTVPFNDLDIYNSFQFTAAAGAEFVAQDDEDGEWVLTSVQSPEV